MNAFSTLPHEAPTSDEDCVVLLTEPGFGRVFTDHMVAIRYRQGPGLHDAALGPRGSISLDPAAAVLHHAQEIFEGLKAYRLPDGRVASFRPDANAPVVPRRGHGDDYQDHSDRSAALRSRNGGRQGGVRP